MTIHSQHKRCGLLLLLIVFYVSIFFLGIHIGRSITYREQEAILYAPEPEHCVLCELDSPYHAPCLLDLSTGEILEMRVYDPAVSLIGSLSVDEEGTLEVLYGDCADLFRDTSSNTCTALIFSEKEYMNPEYFCSDCRWLLGSASMKGYVILDLYNLSDIRPYLMNYGDTLTIRDYTLEASYDDDFRCLKVVVFGHLHE